MSTATSIASMGMRKTSLDELSQFINELQGYILRHKVKPGITGLTQISGCRGETDTLDKMGSQNPSRPGIHKKWHSDWILKSFFLTIFNRLHRMPFSSYSSFLSLKQNLFDILANIGKTYLIEFA